MAGGGDFLGVGMLTCTGEGLHASFFAGSGSGDLFGVAVLVQVFLTGVANLIFIGVGVAGGGDFLGVGMPTCTGEGLHAGFFTGSGSGDLFRVLVGVGAVFSHVLSVSLIVCVLVDGIVSLLVDGLLDLGFYFGVNGLVVTLLDSFVVVTVLELSFQSSANLTLKLVTDLLLVQIVHGIVNVVIVIALLGVGGDHGIGVVIVCVDDAVTIGVLVGVHNELHVESDILSQPVVDDQVLLSIGLGAGCFDQVQDLVTGILNGGAVVLDAQLISIVEGGDHTGQVVKGHVACADSINGDVVHGQQFAQNTELVVVVIVGQEEGSLNAQNVGVVFPLVQILLEQVQDLLLLLLGQRHRVTVSAQNLHVIQFLGCRDDSRIIFVQINAFSLQQIEALDCGQVEGVVNCCGCRILIGGQSSQGSKAHNHGENDQHAQQSHCNLLH